MVKYWYNIGKYWSVLCWIISFEYENSKIFHDYNGKTVFQHGII